MDRLLEATRRVEQAHFWWIGFRRVFEPLIAAATRGVHGARILDCGCDTGANLALFGRYGKAFGFDLSPIGLEYAREYGESRVVNASITHTPFGNEAFHLVTAFDVLYSLSEEQEECAVDEMFRVLRPGGPLLVNVAALSILKGNHSVFAHEVRRSTRRRLRRVLSRAGFIATMLRCEARALRIMDMTIGSSLLAVARK